MFHAIMYLTEPKHIKKKNDKENLMADTYLITLARTNLFWPRPVGSSLLTRTLYLHKSSGTP